MKIRRIGVYAFLCTVSLGCSSLSKPCSQSGDTSWYPPLQGDMQCYQKALPDGRVVNQGLFRQRYKSGGVALEGEFENGRKHGVWIQYDESGTKIAERNFSSGVETQAPLKK